MFRGRIPLFIRAFATLETKRERKKRRLQSLQPDVQGVRRACCQHPRRIVLRTHARALSLAVDDAAPIGQVKTRNGDSRGDLPRPPHPHLAS